VETTVFLIRHGVTDWHRDRKVLGQRDVPLNAEGLRQAQGLAVALAELSISEVVSSPTHRALETAEIIAQKLGGPITRDPRLVDFRVGRWEAMGYDEVSALPEYRAFVADPLNERLPGGETLGNIRDRAVGAVDQALRDAPTGESLALVTHAGIARVILAHYLGIDLSQYHRLHVPPASVSALSFHDDRTPPRVRTLAWRPSLTEIL
jgi:broad specificity phosphatase PhoE